MISPNQEYLRRGNKIQAFVIHMTEGSFKSAVEWCTNIKSQVSYHFIINADKAVMRIALRLRVFLL